MSVRPPARVAVPNGPGRVHGVQTVDRYLLALDGNIEMGDSAFNALERDFVEEAKPFALRLGISYEAWRDVGVPAGVLRRAGLAAEIEVGDNARSY